MTLRITAAPGTHTVTAHSYVVEVRADPPRAVLADPAGRPLGPQGPGAPVGSEPVEADAVDITLDCTSTAWQHRSVRLRCLPDRLELTVDVAGEGLLTDVRLLGGRAVLDDGACGTFRSSTEYASV